jgi:hypothetical protein
MLNLVHSAHTLDRPKKNIENFQMFQIIIIVGIVISQGTSNSTRWKRFFEISESSFDPIVRGAF